MNKQLKLVLGILAFCVSFCVTAEGAIKHKKKAIKDHFKLLEAYTQRTLPGIPGGNPPEAGYHFIIIWGSPIESCFWRGDNGWLTCNIQRAHKINRKDSRNIPGMDYSIEEGGEQLHKGDTVALTPVRGGKFPIPKEIPVTAKNTLYYTTAGSGWIAFPVKTITKKRDVPMP